MGVSPASPKFDITPGEPIPAALELLHSPTRRQDLDQGRGLTHYIGDVLLHGE